MIYQTLTTVSVTAIGGYGSAENLAWLVKEKKIAPHIPAFDKSNRTDGTFSRSDFTGEVDNDRYICPNMPMRKVRRDVREDARDVARAIATTPEYEKSRHRRKKVEMLFVTSNAFSGWHI